MTGTGEYALMLTGERSDAEVDLQALVEAYGPLLFRVAHGLLRSRAEAEDVVQDAFVRVIEHRRKLPEVREMRVWLVRIAWNLALDRRRRKRPEQMDDEFLRSLAAQAVPADRVMVEAQQLAALLDAVKTLPKLERQVLLLSAVEELSTAEVAKVVGKTESATRALLFRARTRLKDRAAKEENRKGGAR